MPRPAVQVHLPGSTAAAALWSKPGAVGEGGCGYGSVLARTGKGRTSFCLNHPDIQDGSAAACEHHLVMHIIRTSICVRFPLIQKDGQILRRTVSFPKSQAQTLCPILLPTAAF